jgi:hypothetical protein
MKEVFKILCECGKEIKGFSKKHLEGNMVIHKISKEHQDRVNLIKNNPGIVFVYDLNGEEIANILSNNPIIIEDIKSIGG